MGHERTSVSGDTVDYYSDQTTLQAHGDVRVRLVGGTTITWRPFSMDLRLPRFLVVGHVHLHTPAGDYDGAGFALVSGADVLDVDSIVYHWADLP